MSRDQVLEAIRNAREKLGLSQEECAGRIGWANRASWSMRERGMNNVSDEALVEMGKVVGLKLECETRWTVKKKR